MKTEYMDKLLDSFADVLAERIAKRMLTKTPQPAPVVAGLSVRDVAERLGVTSRCVWSLINDKKIESSHVGRLVRIPESEINRLLSNGHTTEDDAATSKNDTSVSERAKKAASRAASKAVRRG